MLKECSQVSDPLGAVEDFVGWELVEESWSLGSALEDCIGYLESLSVVFSVS